MASTVVAFGVIVVINAVRVPHDRVRVCSRPTEAQVNGFIVAVEDDDLLEVEVVHGGVVDGEMS